MNYLSSVERFTASFVLLEKIIEKFPRGKAYEATRSLQRVKGRKVRLPNGKDCCKAAGGNLKFSLPIRDAS